METYGLDEMTDEYKEILYFRDSMCSVLRKLVEE